MGWEAEWCRRVVGFLFGNFRLWVVGVRVGFGVGLGEVVVVVGRGVGGMGLLKVSEGESVWDACCGKKLLGGFCRSDDGKSESS